MEYGIQISVAPQGNRHPHETFYVRKYRHHRVARPIAVGKPVNEVFKVEMYALDGQIVITVEAKAALKNRPHFRKSRKENTGN